MKFSVSLTVAALVAGATAQFQGLPTCAEACATNSLPKTCSIADIKCICGSQQFIEGITCCVAKSCDAADIQATIKFAEQLCGSVGVTSLPHAATCPSTGTSTATGTGTSTASVATLSSSSTSSSSSTPMTMTSSSATVASSSTVTSASGTTAPVSSSSSAAATTPTASAAAAPIVHVQQGGIIAAVGGAAAFMAALLA